MEASGPLRHVFDGNSSVTTQPIRDSTIGDGRKIIPEESGRG
jgi:hypothetical protein